MVSILFTRSDSIYNQLGVDCWDIDRDARKWEGGNSIVAHPPCRAWGQMSHLAKPRHDEKELAIYALNMVRKYGGVLEHPRASRLWKDFRLPLGNQKDEFGGFTLCVNQSWFGHKARKNTLLYIVGISPNELPEISIRFDLIEFTINNSVRVGKPGHKKEVSKIEREATPIEFAKFLIAIAEKCNQKRKTSMCLNQSPNQATIDAGQVTFHT